MSTHSCPVCEGPIEVSCVGEYEWDTGAGPFYEITNKPCVCQLTYEQQDALEMAAHQAYLDSFDPL